MTREVINAICKKAKINVEYYDHVYCCRSNSHRRFYVTLATLEIVGGERHYCQQRTLVLNALSIYRNGGNPFDYETEGWERISELN